MCNLKKKGINEPIYKAEIESQMYKTNMMTKASRLSDNLRYWIDIYTLLHMKHVVNKDLLYSTGNASQHSVMTYMGIESKQEWIHAQA